MCEVGIFRVSTSVVLNWIYRMAGNYFKEGNDPDIANRSERICKCRFVQTTGMRNCLFIERQHRKREGMRNWHESIWGNRLSLTIYPAKFALCHEIK